MLKFFSVKLKLPPLIVYFKNSFPKVSPQEVRGHELADYEAHCSLQPLLHLCGLWPETFPVHLRHPPTRANSHPCRFLQPPAAPGMWPALSTWLMDAQRWVLLPESRNLLTREPQERVHGRILGMSVHMFRAQVCSFL